MRKNEIVLLVFVLISLNNNIIAGNRNCNNESVNDSIYSYEAPFLTDTILNVDNNFYRVVVDYKTIKTSYVSQEASYGDGIDSFRYYNNMADLIIFKKDKLIFKKQIFKEDFKYLLPRDFTEKALLASFSFIKVENNNFVFKVFVGEPDTDNEQGFKYLVSTTGKIKIKYADWFNN